LSLQASLPLARLLLKLKFGFHEGFYDANILSKTLKVLPLKTVSYGSGPSRLQTTRGNSAIYHWQVTGRKTQISKPIVTSAKDPVSGFPSSLTCFSSTLVLSSYMGITVAYVELKWENKSHHSTIQRWVELGLTNDHGVLWDIAILGHLKVNLFYTHPDLQLHFQIFLNLPAWLNFHLCLKSSLSGPHNQKHSHNPQWVSTAAADFLLYWVNLLV
jgi:hypothetical protein